MKQLNRCIVYRQKPIFMRKLWYCLLSMVLILAACQKEKVHIPVNNTATNNDQGATGINGTPIGDNTGTIVQDESSGTLTKQDSAAVAGLISSNNLSVAGLAVYGYQTYNAYNQNNIMTDYQLVATAQIVNGLPVFFHDITIVFEDGKFQGPLPSAPYMVGSIALDNKPNLSIDSVRSIFIRTDNAREAQPIDVEGLTITAQLGYYDLNTGFPDKGIDFVKAWLVQPKGGGWPMAYIRDDTQEILQFRALTHSGPQAPGL